MSLCPGLMILGTTLLFLHDDSIEIVFHCKCFPNLSTKTKHNGFKILLKSIICITYLLCTKNYMRLQREFNPIVYNFSPFKAKKMSSEEQLNNALWSYPKDNKNLERLYFHHPKNSKLLFISCYLTLYRKRAIITRSWILDIHKDRIFWNNLFENKEMAF